MTFYESILHLAEVTSFSLDTVLFIFANALLLYELMNAAILAFGIWAFWHFFDWLFSRLIAKRQKKD